MGVPLGLLGGPQAPAKPAAPKVGFNNFNDYMNAYHQAQGSGSNFGGGDVGVANRDVEMMGRGRAPFTAAGLGTAAMNAVGALKGAISPGGLIGLGMTATGTRPGGILGKMFGGDIQDIPGQTPYDRDLISAVTNRSMTRAQADHVQAQRNSDRQVRASQPMLGHGDAIGGASASGGNRGGYGGTGGLGGPGGMGFGN